MAQAPFTIKANFAYTARSDNEANLLANQTYTVLQTDGGANVWWNIKDHTGKTGWIPANYAVVVPGAAVAQPPPAQATPAPQPTATQPQQQAQNPFKPTPQPVQQPAHTQPVHTQPVHTQPVAQPQPVQPQPAQTQSAQTLQAPAKGQAMQGGSNVVSDPNRGKVQLVVVGDGAVGKTCALVSYCKGEYPTEYIPTVFETYCVQLAVDGKDIDLILMDTAGQEDYDRIRPLSYPSTDVFLILYSVVNHASFENIKVKWVPEVIRYCPGIPIILVGTKMDLRDDPKTLESMRGKPISFEDGLQLSNELSRELGQRILFMECSAYTRQGLPEVFQKAVQQANAASQSKRDTVVGNNHRRSCVLL